MKKTLGVLVFGAGILALGAWAYVDHAARIDERIRFATYSIIDTATHDVIARVSGRDIELSGIADTEEEKATLIAEIDAIEGRRVVRENLSVLPAASPFVLSASKESSGLTAMDGNVPTEEARQRFNAVGRGYDASVLTLASGAPDQWTSFAEQGLAALDQATDGTLKVEDTDLHLTATVFYESDKTALEAYGASMPDGFTWTEEIEVMVPIVEPYTFQATKAEGGWSASGYVLGAETGAQVARALEGKTDPDLEFGENQPDGWLDAIRAGVAALDQLDAGQLTHSDTSIRLTGRAASDEIAETVRTAMASLTGDFRVETEIETPAPEPDATLNVRYDARRGVFVGGTAPAGFDAGDVSAALNVPQMRGDISQTAIADGDVLAAKLGRLKHWLGEFETVDITFDGHAMSVTGETLPDAGLSQIQAALEAQADEGDSVNLTRSDAVYGDGYRRINKLTGRMGEFRSGFWLPVRAQVEATQSTCQEDANQVLNDSRVTFVTGSADLDASSRQTLNALASVILPCLEGDETLALEIGGHTDSQGADDANLTLSEARAEAVRTALIARGADANRMEATGFGETDPVASNDTEDGRAANRRTTIRWTTEG